MSARPKDLRTYVNATVTVTYEPGDWVITLPRRGVDVEFTVIRQEIRFPGGYPIAYGRKRTKSGWHANETYIGSPDWSHVKDDVNTQLAAALEAMKP